MPPVELETLVSGDRKIVCETLINGPDNPSSPRGPLPDHLPAESFCLPTLEDEIEWVDRNAVYQRKQSTKGGISSSSSLPNSGHLSSSNPAPSQRVSKSKRSIIGLPKRPDSRQLCQNTRRSCRPATIHFFPTASISKSSVPEVEPGSPKVSCVGRIRKPKSSGKRPSDGEHSPARSWRFWKRFFAVFGRRREEAVVLNAKPPSPMPAMPRRQEMDREEDFPAVVPPSLGEMKKLASGRRWASWGAEDDIHVAGDAWTEVNIAQAWSGATEQR
ncbi:hypothetical protein AAC387_Pa07g2337 [Persea americana]